MCLLWMAPSATHACIFLNVCFSGLNYCCSLTSFVPLWSFCLSGLVIYQNLGIHCCCHCKPFSIFYSLPKQQLMHSDLFKTPLVPMFSLQTDTCKWWLRDFSKSNLWHTWMVGLSFPFSARLLFTWCFFLVLPPGHSNGFSKYDK